MLLNLYTVKGSKDSLIGPWISVGYLIKEEDANNIILNKKVPKIPYIFNYRKNIIKFKDLFTFKNVFIVSISSYQINSKGDYSVALAYKKIMAQAKSLINEDADFLNINYIKEPLLWYERACCMYGVFIRNQYLKKTSYSNHDFILLDSDLEAHLKTIVNYKYLPPNYIIDKCLNYFINIEPKPLWFKNEIDFINHVVKNRI